MRPLSEAIRLDGVLLCEIEVSAPPSEDDLQALLDYTGGALPAVYLDLIRRWDGLSGWFGGPEAPEQGYFALDACAQVLATCRTYELPEQDSTFLPVGSDGGGMFFGIDFASGEWVYVDMVCVGFPDDERRYPTLGAMLTDVLRLHAEAADSDLY